MLLGDRTVFTSERERDSDRRRHEGNFWITDAVLFLDLDVGYTSVLTL